MARANVQEIICKEALNRVEGMPFRWSLNPYRGCAHSCHYCYARATHRYFDLNAGDDFTSVLFAKTNIAEALARRLSMRSWRRETVAIGTATDPYQPIEGTYRLTRACLVVLARFRTPVSIVTKGTLVVRDLDVLRDLTERAGVTVCHSVPTVDEDTWQRSEPGTPPPWQRLEALRRLRANGIRAGVAMAPLLPGLSATPDQMARTAAAAAEAGAVFLWANVVHLGPGVREHFDQFLEREYPHLVADYGRLFPSKYAPTWYAREVEARVDDLKRRHRLAERYDPPRTVPQPVQLTLGL